MPDEVPQNRRNVNFNPNPCTPGQEASNWNTVGDTIENITNEITEITEIINEITEATCEVLEGCEFPVPEDFPDTDPTTIPNIIETLWNYIVECCGEGENFCERVASCCTEIQNCIYDSIYHPGPGFGDCGDVDMCWQCLDVVRDIDVITGTIEYVESVQLQAQVVKDIAGPVTFATDVSFDEEECVLSVTYGTISVIRAAQSSTSNSGEFVGSVTPEFVTVFANAECPE